MQGIVRAEGFSW